MIIEVVDNHIPTLPVHSNENMTPFLVNAYYKEVEEKKRQAKTLNTIMRVRINFIQVVTFEKISWQMHL